MLTLFKSAQPPVGHPTGGLPEGFFEQEAEPAGSPPKDIAMPPDHGLAARMARAGAEAWLREQYTLDLSITAWPEDLSTQLWPDATFAWEMYGRDHGPATLDIALWIGDRLAALALVTGHGPQVIIRYVEGYSKERSRLKGQRLWVVLQVAGSYATSMGKDELWLTPGSPAFFTFCVSKFGFEPRGQQCMLRLPQSWSRTE